MKQKFSLSLVKKNALARVEVHELREAQQRGRFVLSQVWAVAGQ